MLSLDNRPATSFLWNFPDNWQCSWKSGFYTTFVPFVNWLWYQFDAKPGLIKALIMQRLMFSRSLDWLHTQYYELVMKRSLKKHKQSQEILSWFSDGVDQWLSQRPSNVNVQCLPDYAHTVSLQYQWLFHNPWTHKDQRILRIPLMKSPSTSKKEIRNNFLKYLNLYWIKWNHMLSCLLHGVRLSLYRALNYLNG